MLWSLIASLAVTSEPAPFVDLAERKDLQVVVDREAGQYLGHVSSVLLADQRTVLAVYPKGHGKGEIVLKKSTDGGATWSERLATPASWATSVECPSIHRVTDAAGKERLILWSGLYPARLSHSEDEGKTWSELAAAGDWGGIVVMGGVERLADGKYVAHFHDDGRFFAKDGKNLKVGTVYQTVSDDGGLRWSAPTAVVSDPVAFHCEPGIVRSPDGKELAVLMRENNRKKNSHVMFSRDEAKTWSVPSELGKALTGDRHIATYAPDGRLLVTFRDMAEGSPTKGDWLLWIGHYQALHADGDDGVRVRLMDNKDSWDCAYAGLHVLPDGTIVGITYGHWEKGEKPYVVCVRVGIGEIDGMVRAAK